MTFAFIAATVMLVSLPASRFTSPAAREYAAGTARTIVGLIMIVAMRQSKRTSNALTLPGPYSWGIVVPVAACALGLRDAIHERISVISVTARARERVARAFHRHT